MSKIASKPETKNKCQYKILNWPEYNKSLVKRGDITIWVEEGAVDNWYYKGQTSVAHNIIIQTNV